MIIDFATMIRCVYFHAMHYSLVQLQVLVREMGSCENLYEEKVIVTCDDY